MSPDNDSPDPSNFFRRWWQALLAWWKVIASVALVLLAGLHYYKELRQVVPLLRADLESARQYFNPSEPPKQVATPTAPPAPPPATTQSLPARAGPPCVSHTPLRIMEVLAQAEAAHRKKFDKDYGARTLCAPGWFATVTSVSNLATGEIRLVLSGRTGPSIVAHAAFLTTSVTEGDIVQVFGTVHDYRLKGLFTTPAIGLANARVVRR